MGLQTMSNMRDMPEELLVGRADPVYMAHAYLTKVPVPAILPFIETYCPRGGMVVDPFAGSGMTGVAAAMSGRKGRMFDISVLGQHIGSNYVRLVDPTQLLEQALNVVATTREAVGDLYAASCSLCGNGAQLAKAVWSFVYKCNECEGMVNSYFAQQSAKWNKKTMICPHCDAPFSTGGRRVGEEQVLDYVDCPCHNKQIEQMPTAPPELELESIPFPRVEIPEDRQMYKASSLGLNGLTTVASFYSPRNLAVLTELRSRIDTVEDADLRSKLMFAFTAVLTRASKRYQWHHKRPLNAANANYYVASVFYEWNVYDLFLRKVAAITKSDRFIRDSRSNLPATDHLDVTYKVSSAELIPLPSGSADYVFTDPPFGSNLFYADMAIFHEAWLGNGFSDVEKEAVIDRSRGGKRTAANYERLLSSALAECRRIVKPGGAISMVFGNASGSVWGLVQRAIAGAGLEIDPDGLVILNKGQRSVKGLASGFEDVATLDLIITMHATNTKATQPLVTVSVDEVSNVLRKIIAGGSKSRSHIYLELLHHGIREGWSLNSLHLSQVTRTLEAEGWAVDEKSGRLISPAA